MAFQVSATDSKGQAQDGGPGVGTVRDTSWGSDTGTEAEGEAAASTWVWGKVLPGEGRAQAKAPGRPESGPVTEHGAKGENSRRNARGGEAQKLLSLVKAHT